MASMKYDIAVIGGGIVGIATAMRLARSTRATRVGVLDKEDALAQHQSGHNSGVIHSGIYYAPGSLKAKNCVTGVQALLQFCDENEIKYDLCGKIIVATREDELPRLEELHQRGVANGVPGLEVIDEARIREIEPHSAGIKGLYSPKTGIIDYTEVTRAYARHVRAGRRRNRAGREGHANPQAPRTTLTSRPTKGDVEAKYLVNCARALLGRDRAHDGRRRRPAHRPVSRRVLLPAAGGASPGQGPDLSGAGPARSRSWACTSRARSTAASKPGRTRCWRWRARATPRRASTRRRRRARWATAASGPWRASTGRPG